MKKKLEQQIKRAKEFLKMYQGIGYEGSFGAIMIQKDVSEAESILQDFDKTDKAVIKHIIKKLESID